MVAGEAVVVVPRRRESHVLNETGSCGWALMDGASAAEEIAGAIARRYAVDAERAGRDLAAFLAELDARGALETLDAPRASAAPLAAPPEPTSYSPPAVAETQPIDVVAAICDSARNSPAQHTRPGICRAFGACQKPFE